LKLNSIGNWCALGTLVVLSGCGGGTTESGAGGNATSDAGGASNTASSGDSSGGGASGGQKLTGAGATFPNPLYAKWFDTYKAKSGVEINYQSIGSGAGIKQLKSGTVDFGASDVALSDKDLKEFSGEVVQVPTVAGAVAVIYNLPGVDKLKLDGATLAGIFLGDIKTWNDPKIAALNAGVKLPARPITVGHRSDGSGTTNIFTSYLTAASPAWGRVGAGKAVNWPAGLGGKGNDGVAGIVKQTPGGIGYAELAYATKNEISYAALKNKSGQFVEPSVESTIAAEEASAAAKGKAVTDFLKWAMKDGQSAAKPLLYAPLPPAVVALNEKTLATQ